MKPGISSRMLYSRRSGPNSPASLPTADNFNPGRSETILHRDATVQGWLPQLHAEHSLDERPRSVDHDSGILEDGDGSSTFIKLKDSDASLHSRYPPKVFRRSKVVRSSWIS